MYDERPVGGGVNIDFTEVQEDFSNLSVEKLVIHKNWKARKEGYEKVIGNPKRYKADLLINTGKVCTENNQAGLEILMEAFNVITPICTADELDLLCGQPLGLCVDKGLTGRPKSVISSEHFISSLTESGKDIFPALLPCLSHRLPKNKLAAIHMCTTLVTEFGVQNIPIKHILKMLIPLFNDANPQIRKEASNLCCATYKYMGEAIKPLLFGIRDNQMQELERQFSEISVSSAPKKEIKGSKATTSAAVLPISESDRIGECSDKRFQQLEEFPVLNRLPKNFFINALEKSIPWQDRCSLVNDSLMPLLTQPRLKRDNYYELAGLMREYLVDPQAPIMLLGFKMIQECARGLRSDFNSYARGYLNPLFEKMKDKKTSVQEHVHLTLEKLITFHCVSLDQCLEDIEIVTTSKNPCQRLSSINFCIRIIGKINPDEIGKLSTAYPILKKMVTDEKLENRETAYVLLSKLVSIFGEETYEAVVECMEEKQLMRYTTILHQVTGAKQASQTPSSSPAKKVIRMEQGSTKPSSSSHYHVGGGDTPVRGSSLRDSHYNKPLKNIANADDGISLEATLPKKDYVMTTMLGLSNGDTTILDLLRAKEWDRRCEGVERVRAMVNMWTPGQCTKYFDVLLVYLRFYPGLKESTFQVFQAVRTLLFDVQSRAAAISMGAGYVLVTEYTPRLSEPKNKAAVRETCMKIADRFGPRFVCKHMINVASHIHTPKLLQEVNEFLVELIDMFPANRITSSPLDMKGIVEYIRSPCLEQLTPAVRTSSVNVLISLYRHAGSTVDEYIQTLPPAVQHIYEQGIHKERSVSPPPKAASPSSKRGRSDSRPSAQEQKSRTARESVPVALNLEELKACIRTVTTENDWRKRLDAVHKIEEILSSQRKVTLPPTLSEHLVKVLSTRFTESNRNFVVDVLRLIPLVVELSEPSSTNGILQKHVLPPVLCMLGDQKSNLRDEARNVCNMGMKTIGLDGLLEALKKPLNMDSNVCRQNILELMLYGFEHVHRDAMLSKMRLSQLVPGVVNALMDRISDVRALAEQVTGHMIYHISGEPFFRYIFQLKPADQNIVTPIIERQFQLNHGGVPSHLNSTVNTEHDECASRQSSSTRTGLDRSARTSTTARDSRSSRRPPSEQREKPANVSHPHGNTPKAHHHPQPHSKHSARLQNEDSNTFSRSGTASSDFKPLPTPPAPVYATQVPDASYSIQDILLGIRTADSSVACEMCSAFLRHMETGVDCGTNEMAQAMVDRLVQNTIQVDEDLVMKLSACLNALFSNPRSASRYQNAFLFQILGKLFDCLLCDAFIRSPSVIRTLNHTVLKLLEGCVPDEVFSALLSRMTSYSTTYLQTGRREDLKFVQVTVKCIMRHNIQNVSPENVVLCCHEYLLQHPPSTFKSVDDLPVRTVKTILQTATRQYGSRLLPMSIRLIGNENLVTHFIRACLETKEKATENERHAREDSLRQQRASASMPASSPNKRVLHSNTSTSSLTAQSPISKRGTVGSARSTTSSTVHADPLASGGMHNTLGSKKSASISRHGSASISSTSGTVGASSSSTLERIVSHPAPSAANNPTSSQSAASPPSMAMIFNKIRSYQTSSEGIDELYLFLKERKVHNAEEFDFHFNRCSQPFRFFIKRKLESKLEEDRSGGASVKLPKSITTLA